MTIRKAMDTDYDQILAIWLEGVIETFQGIEVDEKSCRNFQGTFLKERIGNFG